MLAAGIDSHITLVKGRTFANPATHPQANYSKIPMIRPVAFLGGGGGEMGYTRGEAYTRTTVIFLRFSAQYLSLLLIFSHFNF